VNGAANCSAISSAVTVRIVFRQVLRITSVPTTSSAAMNSAMIAISPVKRCHFGIIP
jgi:hypothetical protein